MGRSRLRDVGAHLDDETDARAYVEAFLEVTRGALVIIQPITSLDDLHWRPGSDTEEAARAALVADPPAIEPSLSRTADGFHVELTLVVDQRLQRNIFDVTRRRGDCEQLVPRAGGAPPAPDRALTYRSAGPTGVRVVGPQFPNVRDLLT